MRRVTNARRVASLIAKAHRDALRPLPAMQYSISVNNTSLRLKEVFVSQNTRIRRPHHRSGHILHAGSAMPLADASATTAALPLPDDDQLRDIALAAVKESGMYVKDDWVSCSGGGELGPVGAVSNNRSGEWKRAIRRRARRHATPRHATSTYGEGQTHQSVTQCPGKYVAWAWRPHLQPKPVSAAIMIAHTGIAVATHACMHARRSATLSWKLWWRM